MTKVSRHISIERLNRVEYIIDMFNGNFGEEVYSCTDGEENNCRKVLTSKGIIYIQSLTNHKIITMYIATVQQAYYIYVHSHKRTTDFMPQKLYNQIKKNKRFLTPEYFML